MEIIYNIQILLFHNISKINYLWNSNRIFNYTPLIHAVDKNYTEIIDQLLSQEGIDINCKDILNRDNL